LPTASTGGLGDLCEYNNDCDSDFCLAIVGESNPPYCSTNCAGLADCPCGMKCSQFQGGVAYCTLGGPQNCTPSGNPCATADECISLTCVDGVCRDACEVGGAPCAAGQACQRIASTSINGYCVAAGDGLFGDSCGQDADCASLLCLNLGGVQSCQQPCDPQSSYCGDGMACLKVIGTTFNVCDEVPDATGAGTGTSSGPGAGTDSGTGTGEGTDGGTTGGFTTGGSTTGGSTTGGSTTTGGGEVDEAVKSSSCTVGRPSRSSPITPTLFLLLLLILALGRRPRAGATRLESSA
jgi:MYXO-CTERM domain-containing protein